MVEFTEAAAVRVKSLIEADAELTGKVLRLFVQGGGCTGFQYGFTFDDEQDGDTVIETGGVKLAIDPMSFQYLEGAKVDFKSGIEGDMFVIDNPNATTTCGCGQSFSA